MTNVDLGEALGGFVTTLWEKNQIFSRATWMCHRLQQAINCVNTQARLHEDESCPTIFELGHCWKETPHGEYLLTECPRLNPIPSETPASNTTTRRCYAESFGNNGTTKPAGWLGIYDVYHDSLKFDCEYYEDDYEYYDQDYIPVYGDSESMDNVTSTTAGMKTMRLTWYLTSLMTLSILSFIATLVSLLLMVFFLRKCTRIYIHMNLLAAFMLRSLVFIWSQTIFIWQDPSTIEGEYTYITNLTEDLAVYESSKFNATHLPDMSDHYNQYCVAHLQNEKKFLSLCRLYPSFQHYIVLVEFSWLTCEGLYLILLQQRPAVLFERINPLRWFVALSWLLPAVIVSVWIAVMLNRPDGEFTCFANDKYIVWIVEAPIQLYILICFVIFVILLHDILRKLRAPDYISGRGNTSLRMSKATLSLIPLLGIQYSLVPYLTKDFVGQSIEDVTLPVSLVVTAAHGIVVSFLYCFTSNEMKIALIRRWRLHKELQGIYNEISSRRQSRDTYTSARPISKLLNRYYTPRSSLLPDRQRSLGLSGQTQTTPYDSRNETVFKYSPTVLPPQIETKSDDNRLSTMSKQSHESSDSYGYYSSPSANQDDNKDTIHNS